MASGAPPSARLIYLHPDRYERYLTGISYVIVRDYFQVGAFSHRPSRFEIDFRIDALLPLLD
jgi:hypothetical protein